jgi:putative ribosome biogenesis GTPase RsgA
MLVGRQLQEQAMFERKHKFEINYIYRNDPHAKVIDAEADRFSRSEAARYLIQLHEGDAENKLVMPDADAGEEELLQRAETVGITDIRVTRLEHDHKEGTTPGHYQQP